MAEEFGLDYSEKTLKQAKETPYQKVGVEPVKPIPANVPLDLSRHDEDLPDLTNLDLSATAGAAAISTDITPGASTDEIAQAKMRALISPSKFGDTPEGVVKELVVNRGMQMGEALNTIKSLYDKNSPYIRGLPNIDQFISQMPGTLKLSLDKMLMKAGEPVARVAELFGGKSPDLADVDTTVKMYDEVTPPSTAANIAGFVPEVALWTALQAGAAPLAAKGIMALGKAEPAVAEAIAALRAGGPVTREAIDLLGSRAKYWVAQAASMYAATSGTNLLYGKEDPLVPSVWDLGLAGTGYAIGSLFRRGSTNAALHFIEQATGVKGVGDRVKTLEQMLTALKTANAPAGLYSRVLKEGAETFGEDFGNYVGRWAARTDLPPEEFNKIISDVGHEGFEKAARSGFDTASEGVAAVRGMRQGLNQVARYMRSLGASDAELESIATSPHAFSEGAAKWMGRWAATTGQEVEFLEQMTRNLKPKYYKTAIDEFNNTLEQMGYGSNKLLRAEARMAIRGEKFAHSYQDHMVVDVPKEVGGGQKYYAPYSQFHFNELKAWPLKKEPPTITTKAFKNPIEVPLRSDQIPAYALISRLKGNPKMAAAALNVLDNAFSKANALPQSHINDIMEGVGNQLAKRFGYDSIVYKGATPDRNMFVDLKNVVPLEPSVQKIVDRMEKSMQAAGRRAVGKDFLSVALPIAGGLAAWDLMAPRKSEAMAMPEAGAKGLMKSFAVLFDDVGKAWFGHEVGAAMHQDILEHIPSWTPEKGMGIGAQLVDAIKKGFVRAGRAPDGPFVEFNWDNEAARNRALAFMKENHNPGDIAVVDAWKNGERHSTFGSLADAEHLIKTGTKPQRVSRMRDFLGIAVPVGIGMGLMMPPDEADAIDFKPILKLAGKFKSLPELTEQLPKQTAALIKQAAMISDESNPSKVIQMLKGTQDDLYNLAPKVKAEFTHNGPDFIGLNLTHDDLGPFPLANIYGVVDADTGTWYPQVTSTPLGFTKDALAKVGDLVKGQIPKGKVVEDLLPSADKLSSVVLKMGQKGKRVDPSTLSQILENSGKSEAAQIIDSINSTLGPRDAAMRGVTSRLDTVVQRYGTIVRALKTGQDLQVNQIASNLFRVDHPLAKGIEQLQKEGDRLSYIPGRKNRLSWQALRRLNGLPVISRVANPRSLAGVLAATYLLKDFVWPEGRAEAIEPPVEPLLKVFGQGVRGVADDVLVNAAKARTTEELVNATMERIGVIRKAVNKMDTSAMGAADKAFLTFTSGGQISDESLQMLGSMDSGEGFNSVFRTRPWASMTENPLWQLHVTQLMTKAHTMLTGSDSVAARAKNAATEIIKDVKPELQPEVVRAIHGLRTTSTGGILQTQPGISSEANSIAEQIHREIVDPLWHLQGGIDPRAAAIMDELGLSQTEENWRIIKTIQEKPLGTPNPRGATAAHEAASLRMAKMLNWKPWADISVPYKDSKFLVQPIKNEYKALQVALKQMQELYGPKPTMDQLMKMAPIERRMKVLELEDVAARNARKPSMEIMKLTHPAPQFKPLEERPEIPGLTQETNLKTLLERHIDTMLSKTFFDEQLTYAKFVRDQFRTNPRSESYALSDAVEEFMNTIRGVKSVREDLGHAQLANSLARAVGSSRRFDVNDIRNATSKILEFTWFTKLGIGVRWPLTNMTQPATGLFGVVGVKSLFRGFARVVNDPAIRREALEMGAVAHAGGLRAEVEPSRYTKVLDWLPSLTENFNRMLAYSAGKDQALSEIARTGSLKVPKFIRYFDQRVLTSGDPEKIARAYATAVAHTTQFIYGPIGKAPILSGGSSRRVLGQFKTYTSALGDLMIGMAKHAKETGDVGPLLRTSAGLVALGGVGMIPLYGAVRRYLLSKGVDYLPHENQSGIGYLIASMAGAIGQPETKKAVEDALNYVQLTGSFNPSPFQGGSAEDILSGVLGPTAGAAVQPMSKLYDLSRGEATPQDVGVSFLRSVSPLAASVPAAAQMMNNKWLNDWFNYLGYRGEIYSPSGKLQVQPQGQAQILSRALNLQPSLRSQRYNYKKDILAAMEGGQNALAQKMFLEAKRRGFIFSNHDFGREPGKSPKKPPKPKVNEPFTLR